MQRRIITTGILGPGMLIALGALTLLAPLGSDAMLPALPAIADEFWATADRAQLTLTAGLIGVAVGQLAIGTLSDSWGRRGLLIAGAAFMAAAGALAAVAPTLEVLLAACALSGLGGAAGLVLSRAVAADLSGGSALVRIYALLGVLVGVGPIIGAVGGAVVLDRWGWRAIFVATALLAGAALALVVLLVPESLPAERRAPTTARAFAHGIRTVLGSPAFIATASIAWFGFGAVFAYIAASPFLLQSRLGFTPGEYALVLAADGVGLMATGALTGRLAATTSPMRLIGIGLSVMAGGALIAVGAIATGFVSAWTLVPSMILIGVSMGFVFGPSTALALEPVPELTGTALAVLGCVQFVVAGLVAPLVGLGGENDATPYALLAAACTTGAIVAWAVLARLLRRAGGPSSVAST